MSDWVFVGAAYGLTAAVLAGYRIYLHRRLSRARGEFARLQQNQGDQP
jgi:hypothetical protein